MPPTFDAAPGSVIRIRRAASSGSSFAILLERSALAVGLGAH